MMEKRLILNRIQTPDGTILTSYHRHDFNSHTDKNGLMYFVDGGLSYQRTSFYEEPDKKHINLSVYSDQPFEIIRQNFHRGSYGKLNDEPLHWITLNNMSDNHLNNVIEYNKNKIYLETNDQFFTNLYLLELEYRKINNISVKD